MPPEIQTWLHLTQLYSRKWTCGHCGRATGGDRGYANINSDIVVYICLACGRPTYFEGSKQVPGVAYGTQIEELPDTIAPLYDEARNCFIVNAFTAAVLACRKILMHIAVAKGAEEGKSFVHYINYILDGNILPQHFREWVDQIRLRSNDANHQIILMDQRDATDILAFTEMLLKLLYEYPARAAKGRA